jgi:hypothetical protein
MVLDRLLKLATLVCLDRASPLGTNPLPSPTISASDITLNVMPTDKVGNT